MAEKISKRVKTLSDFMKWLEQFNDGQYLFRGVSKHTHKIEASAYRRLPEADRNNPNKLLKINQALIDKARLLGHDHKDGRYLSDLELLAELQHFGAATCLIDFTRNALIALWFACQRSSSGAANGKVVAVRADDPVRFKTITPEMVAENRPENKIDCFFETDDRGRSLLYQWQPKQQNNRVIAQQSVFIFGGSPIEMAAECIIQESCKSEILRALESSASITEASIYPDFDGFARQHAQNKPYIEPDVQGYLQSGISAQMENKLDDAITYYSEVISLQPDSSILAKTHAARGSIYANKREYDLAIADWTKAIELAPEDADVYNSRGVAYTEKSDFAAAVEDFNKVIELDPEDAGAYCNRGIAYAGQSDFGSAIADYNKAIELDPENVYAYNNRGVAYTDQSDFGSAITDYNKAIELDPKDAGAYYNRGVAYAGQSDFDSAIADYSKAIELDPEDARVYNSRGVAYVEQSDFDSAIEGFNKAIELDPEDAGAYCNRGEAWLHLKEWQKARTDLTTAKDMDYDIITSFQNDYESVEDFEAKNEVKVPEDIASLLQQK